MRISLQSTGRLLGLGALASSLACGGGGGDGGGIGTVTPVPVASVEVSPTTVNLEPGGTSQLSAIARSAAGAQLNRPITWSVASAAIATVTQTGLVTGVGEGNTSVTATAEGRSATASVTVRTPVASVVVTPPNASTTVGGPPVQLQAATLSASGAQLQGRTIAWSSANAPVATVSQTGSVTGVAVGSATIIATSEGRSGSATVTVAAPDPCASFRSINVGQSFSGTLVAGDCRLADQTALQTFKVTLTAPTALEIQMTSTVLDAYLYVLDSKLKVIAEDDDGGATGTNARVLMALPAGDFFILANTFDPNTFGAFQLSVALAPGPCVTARPASVPAGVNGALGATTSCRLNDDRLVDFYDVNVAATSTVRIDMSSSAVDAFLVVFDAAGKLVAQDDDAGIGVNARIEVQLDAGHYLVVASALPNQLGAYRLDVAAVLDPCAFLRPLNLGQTATSALTTNDCAIAPVGPIPYVQRWLLNLATTTPLQIDMASTVVDAYLIIQNATTGAVVAENDDVSQTSTNARVAANFPAGLYIVNATTFSFGEVGQYTLLAAAINPTTPVSVALTPNTIALSAGQTQQLTATVTGNANTAVTWETSASAVADVSTTGLVRALTPGNATITARSVADPSKTATSAITVSQTQTGTANIDIAAMYLVQAVQHLNGSVKLVANRDAVVRVFLRGSRTGIGGVTVRVRVFQGATVLQTLQATVTPTLTVDESCCSANILIPATHIRAGVSIVADADPGNLITESNENDNSFPLSGTPQPLNVTTVSDFNVRFVPIRQNRSGQLGVFAPNIPSLLRSVWPLSTVNVTTRQALSIDYSLLDQSFNEWGQLVRDVELARRADGANAYYYGLVRVSYTSGVLGLANGIPALSAVGVDQGTPFGAAESGNTFAHEIGHTIGLRHAPCGGAAGPDPGYPFQGAITGAYGMDIASGNVIKGPTEKDIMSYCDPNWVSAYNYNIVLNQRAQFPNGTPGNMVSSSVMPVLMISGAVSTGRVTIDGSFAMEANPSPIDPTGRFVLEGFASDGKRLFSHRFSPFVVADARPNDEAFVVGVPVDSETASTIARLAVREIGGTRMQIRSRATQAGADLRSTISTSRTALGAQLNWSTSTARMVLVRDPQTREIIGVSRTGTLDLAKLGTGSDVELLVSDGVTSVKRTVNTANGAILR